MGKYFRAPAHQFSPSWRTGWLSSFSFLLGHSFFQWPLILKQAHQLFSRCFLLTYFPSSCLVHFPKGSNPYKEYFFICLSLPESQLLQPFGSNYKSLDAFIPLNSSNFWSFLLVSGADCMTKAIWVDGWFSGTTGSMGVDTRYVSQGSVGNLSGLWITWLTLDTLIGFMAALSLPSDVWQKVSNNLLLSLVLGFHVGLWDRKVHST